MEDNEERVSEDRGVSVTSERILSSVQEKSSSSTWALRPSYTTAFKCGELGRARSMQGTAGEAGQLVSRKG